MPYGTGNFRNFQISRKNDNTNFWKFSVPFDFEPRFPENLVEWNAPKDSYKVLSGGAEASWLELEMPDRAFRV